METDDSVMVPMPLARLTGLQVDVLLKDDIEVLSTKPYLSKPKDLADARFGFPNQSSDEKCSTCGALDANLCDGHIGCIPLPRVLYNPHFLADIVNILNKVCPYCGRSKQDKEKPTKLLAAIRRKNCTTFSPSSDNNCKLQFQQDMELLQDIVGDEKTSQQKSYKDTPVSDQTVCLDVSCDDSKSTRNSYWKKDQNSYCKSTINSKEFRKVDASICKKSATYRVRRLRKVKKDVNYNESSRQKPSQVSVTRVAVNKVSPQKIESSHAKGFSKTDPNGFLLTTHSKLFPKDKSKLKPNECSYCQTENGIRNIDFVFTLVSKNICGKMISTIEIKMNPKQRWTSRESISHQMDIRSGCKDFFSTANGPSFLLPFQARNILRKISDKTVITNADRFFLENVGVPPNCFRITERHHLMMNGPLLAPDEKTKVLQKLLQKIDQVRGSLFEEGFSVLHAKNIVCTLGQLITDYFQCSKLAEPKISVENSKKAINAGLTWLKKTVLGKRSDFSMRAVAVGDPSIGLDEVLIPTEIAEKLSICEKVNYINWSMLKTYTDKSISKHGIVFIRRNGVLIPLIDGSILRIGDVVYRDIKDGDMIIINRTPSVHRHSLIAFRARLLDMKSTIAINPLVCNPFGADFDGDCLHGFVPQSQTAKAEAAELLSLSKQLINAQGGQALFTISNDCLLAAYAITSNDVFINKHQMQELQVHCCSEVPIAAILKAPKIKSPLWTGKQLFMMILPNDLNFEGSEVLVSKGEILHCAGTSEWLSNLNTGIFQKIFSQYGSLALNYVGCWQAVLNDWISRTGFTVSLQDVHIAPSSFHRSKMIDEVGLALSEAKISTFSKCTLYSTLFTDDLRSELTKKREYHFMHEASLTNFRNMYFDIVKVVAGHTRKDNCIFAMIKAGSKGTLQKFVQQGACVGLQLYKGKSAFPFGVPKKLYSSYAIRTSERDPFTKVSSLSYATASMATPFIYGLVETSFFEGLDPIEYFVHAVSNRGNSFGQGAEIPGQLFRKIMFFLRDLYVAYDGTIRNLYGHQIVQFSSADMVHCFPRTIDEAEVGVNLGGEPVGALAATSIGELAYATLEKQFSNGQKHPLKILTEILCTRHNRKGTNKKQNIVLRLSEKLKGIHCGFEYGAMKIKEHLEQVHLSELVESYKIVYDHNALEETSISVEVSPDSLCPWVMCCFLSERKLKDNSIKIERLINRLDNGYRSLRNRLKGMNLPKMFIRKGTINSSCNGHSASGRETHSLLFLVFSSAETSLDVVCQVLVPKVMDLVVKGDPDIASISILPGDDTLGFNDNLELTRSRENGELVVIVEYSPESQSHCPWKAMLNACDGVTELIDWHRSVPESKHLISCSMGIEAARRACLLRLEHVCRMMDRPVKKMHLNLVVDCLSLTGNFSSLYPIYLKKIVSKGYASAPFLQSCFMNPRKNLVEASRERIRDSLSGTLDALMWGNAPPLGTGMKIDILLNKKMHEASGVNDLGELFDISRPTRGKVCDMSSTVKNEQKSCRFDLQLLQENGVKNSLDHRVHKTKRKCMKAIPRKDNRKGRPKQQCSNAEIMSEEDFPPGFEIPGKHSVSGDIDKNNSFVFSLSMPAMAEKHSICLEKQIPWRHILHERYKMGETLSECDQSLVLKGLQYHPRYHDKIGTGIKEVKIGCNPEFPDSRCFVLLREDGSLEDFSYHKCIEGCAALSSASRP